MLFNEFFQHILKVASSQKYLGLESHLPFLHQIYVLRDEIEFAAISTFLFFLEFVSNFDTWKMEFSFFTILH